MDDLLRRARFDLPTIARLSGIGLAYLKQLSAGNRGAGPEMRQRLAEAFLSHAGQLAADARELSPGLATGEPDAATVRWCVLELMKDEPDGQHTKAMGLLAEMVGLRYPAWHDMADVKLVAAGDFAAIPEGPFKAPGGRPYPKEEQARPSAAKKRARKGRGHAGGE